MYRQGLGDCFLLTFWTEERPAHMLIDCGVLKGTAEAQTRMQNVARSVLETTGGHVDVLVATHEHWDHLSGFLQAEELFNTLTVGEVWLAWTEDPDDELAQELGKRKARALRAVTAAAQQLTAADDQGARRAATRLNGLLDFQGELGVEGRPTTGKALDWVKSRRTATVRYLRPGGLLDLVAGLAGIRIYVLGPPHDRRLIKRSDPSTKHSEVYELAGDASADLGFFAAAAALEGDAQSGEQPFDEWFRVSEADARAESFFAEYYEASASYWRQIEHDWLGVAGRLALQLDSDTNNTSLVLAFELSGRGPVLLFPGDAQVGNWLSWESLQWEIKDGTETRTVSSHDLLARTVLYKVGHHGSHNATLRERGLELMASSELTAMIPVNRETAKKMDWKMPFPPLYRRLQEKTNGRILDADAGLEENPGGLSAEEWSRFAERADVQQDWLDYTIDWEAD
jgi:hypothetical protein